MAPPTYSSSRHHIGLKERGTSTTYGFMLAGAYTMEMQREALGAPDFGGATDLIGQSPSLSRWTQDDFVGGSGQYTWGRDDAMFADCTNFMSDQLGRSLISVPPMVLKKAVDSDSHGTWVSDVPRNMFLVSNSIYIVWGHAIARYQIDTDTLTWVNADSNSVIMFAEWDPTDQVIMGICNTTVTDDRPYLRRWTSSLGDPSFDADYIGPSGTENQSCMGGTIRDSNILMQIGRKLWYGDPPDTHSPTVNGTVKWKKVGRLPGKWKDSIPFNGMTYILYNDGLDSPTYSGGIIAFDGADLLPICRFSQSFYGKCMVEYGGRIFVGGTGTDSNGGEQYAELHELTGSSVRLVRTFAPETRNAYLGGVEGEWPQSIDTLTVHEGMLWFGQKGKKMMSYDLTSDGFFGGSEIQSNADLYPAKMTAGRGRLWAYMVDPTDDSKHGIYRIAQPADTISTWNPTLITSDFAYEPAMKKRWSEFVVMTKYGGLNSLEYSTDGGQTWVALTTTVSSRNKVYFTRATMVAVPVTENIRFRIKVDTATGDAVTYHRELIAFSLSYAMLDTGKRAWSFVVNGSYEVETLDAEFQEGITQVQDTTDIADTLWAWANGKTALTMTDVDGTSCDVQIVGYRKSLPIIGPKPSGETHPEAHHVLTVIEV